MLHVSTQIFSLVFSKKFGHWLFMVLKVSLQGISTPPFSRSDEYLLLPVTQQLMVPPLLRNNDAGVDIF